MIRVLWNWDEKEVIVVVKGSHNLWDWGLNAACWRRNAQLPGCDYAIHAGYHYQIHQESMPTYNTDSLGLSVATRLKAFLEPLIALGKNVSFTGHSSGGALACVLADSFESIYPKAVKRVVTFGQPAIGGIGLKRHYRLQHKTYRICCDLDVVTFLPPFPLLYAHVGKLLWLYNGRIYENTPTLIRLWRSLLSWLIRPFSYHLMSKYIRNKDFFDER